MDNPQHARQGGDIFASDMHQPEVVSRIAEGFENTTVFITGGTGFIGKLFLEKLLRMSKTVKVLILVRPKKNKDPVKRFQEIFEGPNMVPLKLANPKFAQQIRLVNGDCAERDLGLSEEDKQMLIDEVNYVIHCAATVRFDENLRTAALINVRGVKDLIGIAKRMKDLRAFLHVSTAYSHCHRKEIDEKFYETAMSGDDLLRLVDSMDQKRLTAITPELIKEWPNTYTFTKAIAENVVKTEASRLPIAVLRPSIVISSESEPLAGWIDNLYGVTGIMLASGLGFMRVLRADLNNKGDMIPADHVTNAGFAVLWDVSRTRSSNDNIEFPSEETEEEVPIYNAVSSVESPITWGEMQKLLVKEGNKIPSELQIWYPMLVGVANAHMYQILTFLLHTIPAYLTDGVCYCLGREQRLVKGYEKFNKFAAISSHFTLNEWQFHNRNLQALWRKLEPEDRRLFKFSMKDFDWRTFSFFYIRGARVYLLKDPLETVPRGRVKFRWLMAMHFATLAILAIFGLALLNYLFKLFI